MHSWSYKQNQRNPISSDVLRPSHHNQGREVLKRNGLLRSDHYWQIGWGAALDRSRISAVSALPGYLYGPVSPRMFLYRLMQIIAAYRSHTQVSEMGLFDINFLYVWQLWQGNTHLKVPLIMVT